MGCSTPGFLILHNLPELAQTHVHWAGDEFQPSHPLLSPSPSAFNLSQHQGLFWWVRSPCSPRDSQESSPTPQFKSISSSVLSLLHCPILTSKHDNRKTVALTIWSFLSKVMSLLFNMLSTLVITFLPRSKNLLISRLLSPSAVILEPPKNKISHCFHCFLIYLPWSDGARCHDLHFLNVEL